MYWRTLESLLKRILLLFIGLTFCATAFAVEQVHLVIDVSGNIQRLDPQKQRIAALKEFIHQLPDGTKAGIWTYAGAVNRLVSPGIVNDAWRKNALQAVNGISGYGSYSNVGEALNHASFYWRDNNKSARRSIILLTDSGFRPSDNLEKNEAAKQQLLHKFLPTMQQSGVKIYVLGFGKADKNLYTSLAEGTHGYYKALSKPADLKPAFQQLQSTLALPERKSAMPLLAANEPVAKKEKVSTSTIVSESANAKNAPTATQAVPPVVNSEIPASNANHEITTPSAGGEINISPEKEAKLPTNNPQPIMIYDHPPVPENLAKGFSKAAEIVIPNAAANEPTSTTTTIDAGTEMLNEMPATVSEQNAASTTQAEPVNTNQAPPESATPQATTEEMAESLAAEKSEEMAEKNPQQMELGTQEAEEIRHALENAEAELNNLLKEFSTLPKDQTASSTQPLNTQQTSGEPLVITLADGSVLVTSDEQKLHEMNAQQTTQNTEAITIADQETPTEVAKSADNAEWPGIATEKNIWPLILTILVVINLVVIVLLFIGRYFWMRHKRKNADKTNHYF